MSDFEVIAFAIIGVITFYILWVATEDWPRR
jgi:hypothetical protein